MLSRSKTDLPSTDSWYAEKCSGWRGVKPALCDCSRNAEHTGALCLFLNCVKCQWLSFKRHFLFFCITLLKRTMPYTLTCHSRVDVAIYTFWLKLLSQFHVDANLYLFAFPLGVDVLGRLRRWLLLLGRRIHDDGSRLHRGCELRLSWVVGPCC